MIYCNECKYEFEPKIRTKHIENDVEEVFFNCPECHERYTAYYLNDEAKEIQKLIKKHWANVFKRQLLQKQLDKEFNRLEEIYSTQ